MEYRIKRGAQEFGPYSLADLKRYLQEGRIAPTDLAKSEGMYDWQPVADVAGTMDIPPPTPSASGVDLGGVPPSMVGPPQPTESSSLFAALVGSFFSADLYREAAARWTGGRAAAYLLLLVSLCWLPSMFQLDAGIREFVEKEIAESIADFPAVRVSGGEAFVDGPQPYVLLDLETGDPLLILDTTGAVVSLEDSAARVLLTRDKLFFQDDHQTRIVELSQFEGLELDRSSLEYFFGLMSPWLAIGIYPFVAVGALAYRLLVAAFWALIGLIVAKATGATLDFPALFHIAAVAMTPMYLLNTILSFSRTPIPMGFLISISLVLGYLVFGVRSTKLVARQPNVMAAGGSM